MLGGFWLVHNLFHPHSYRHALTPQHSMRSPTRQPQDRGPDRCKHGNSVPGHVRITGKYQRVDGVPPDAQIVNSNLTVDGDHIGWNLVVRDHFCTLQLLFQNFKMRVVPG